VRRRQGRVPDDVHFDSSLPLFATEIGIAEAFDRLQERQLYIAVYNPESDPEYRRIIEGLLAEIALAIAPFRTPINWYSTYLFISAHDAVTPYHMDREMNFLLQVRGTKSVRLWDPNDDRVMTPAQRDHLFSYDDDSRPRWRPELEQRALRFELQPGLGVHHPFIAPHLVHTGPAPSISLAITFRTPQSDRWTEAHRFNEHLRRRLGCSGGRVGRSAALDRTKALALKALARARNIAR